jgi:hypothetical protein
MWHGFVFVTLTYPRQPITFISTFSSFSIPSERAFSPLGEDREAGANPALPRNCK